MYKPIKTETELIRSVIEQIVDSETVVYVTARNRGSAIDVMGKLYTRKGSDEIRIDALNFVVTFCIDEIADIKIGISTIHITL